MLLQVVLSLGLVHFLAHVDLELLGQPQHLELVLERRVDFAQPVGDVEGLEQLLLLDHAQREIGGQEIRQRTRALDALENLQGLLRHVRARLDHLPGRLPGVVGQGLDLDPRLDLILVWINQRTPIRFGRDELLQPRPQHAVHQQAVRAVGHPQELEHLGNRADAVDIVDARVLDLFTPLGKDRQQLVARQHGVYQPSLLLAPDTQGNHRARKDNYIAHRQHR